MLRWEDCVKRDARKAGEEEDWKKKTRCLLSFEEDGNYYQMRR